MQQACEEEGNDNINATLNNVAYAVCAAEGTDFTKDDWLFDSCTSSHISPNRRDFREYKPIDGTVKGIGNSPARVLGRGTIVVDFEVDGRTITHTLSNVLHVPDAPNCLISVGRYDASGGRTEFYNGGCILKNKDGKIVGKGLLTNKIYLLFAHVNNSHNVSLQGSETQTQTIYKQANQATWEEWHK